jgi:hypothetical protein
VAQADVHWLRGHRMLARIYGDSAASAFARLLAGAGGMDTVSSALLTLDDIENSTEPVLS